VHVGLGHVFLEEASPGRPHEPRLRREGKVTWEGKKIHMIEMQTMTTGSRRHADEKTREEEQKRERERKNTKQ